jgi:glucose-6-phosphate isomerase
MDAAWRKLESEGARLRPIHLRELFAADAGRFDALSASFDDLLVHCSKEKIDAAALGALLKLAEAADVAGRREALFTGAPLNLTEGRAVLHMALRGGAGAAVTVDGVDVMPAVRETLDRFLDFAEDVRSGRIGAADAGAFTDVVSIGIGGSDLGPVMATRALRPDHDGPRVHFVSNVDLVIVASKTFTTLETMTNARSARAWLEQALGDAAGAQMVAISTNLEATAAFGIEASRVFGFWDWVGGRYSLWSAIGLPVAMAVGAERFREFLEGAAAMDRHFRTAPLAENLPILLALVGIWRRNVMGWPSIALIPYQQRLERFPAYVQQLDMESNGKRVTREGADVDRATGPVIWGEPGTNAQHSFFQLLHQGIDVIPVDFIAAEEPREKAAAHQHTILLANCLAQGQALAFGKTEAEVRADMAAAGNDKGEIDLLAPHRTFPGDRPSTTILHQRLDPFSLGRLIALFEHKVFVQGVIWNVNSFDQWGVELGKALANAVVAVLEGGDATPGLDSSTGGLIARIRRSQA